MTNGIVNVYKERGYTSFDVVAKMRGMFHQKKIGHTGTLDPDAEGVLPVCLGSATKVCDVLTDKDKEYEAVLLLGLATDTQDATGTVLSEREVCATDEEVRSALVSFVGEIMQVPPMYSALKVNGQKLCDLARKGMEVERKARPVTVYGIEILDMCLPRVHMRDALRLSEIGEALAAGKTDFIRPVDSVFQQYPAVTAAPEAQKLVDNGNRLPAALLTGADALETGTVRLYDAAGRFAGLYSCEQKAGDYRPLKLFFDM